ncbi:MAG: DNA methyltransferase [Ignavibacteriales bacterium]|nr:DNA methyltransferase [Ignavibacteriales bacterium]
MPPHNDLDLDNWKAYPDILTDSLWLFDERERGEGHSADYHGNFVPQIPNQLMRRFTRKGETVLDPFLGGGTTLLECLRLGRAGVGVDIDADATRRARVRLRSAPNEHGVSTAVVTGDAAAARTKAAVRKALGEGGSAQLLILHPPYHNVVRFSERPGDLSRAPNVERFVEMFERVFDNLADFLDRDRHCALVVGDAYAGARWIPLGFLLMDAILRRPAFALKSVIVKNMSGNRAKRNRENLWRYRALKGGYYIFKHEYVFLFQKCGEESS